MSSHIFGRLVVGVPVKISDLFSTNLDVDENCENCKSEFDRLAKFCSSCGHELIQVEQRKPLQKFQLFLKNNFSDVFKDKDLSKVNIEDLFDVVIFNIESHISGPLNMNYLALGKSVIETEGWNSSCLPVQVNFEKILLVKSLVESMVKTLDLENKEAFVYLSVIHL